MGGAFVPRYAPAGFPNCHICPHRVNGPVHVCVSCAQETLTPIGPNRCPVCSQTLDATAICRNSLCRGTRYILRISAVATYSGALATAIRRLKYDHAWGWMYIFGRLITGYLDANVRPTDVD
ncbi:MAG: ComF family protein, partial [Pseudonocardia sp.]